MINFTPSPKAAKAFSMCLLFFSLSGCITPNGVDPNGNSFLFKTFGLVNTPIGPMELSKGLGLPYALGNNVGSFDFSKPTIFLPNDIKGVELRGDYWVNGSSIIVISAPTASCQYDYILITINSNRTYFARRIEPCDHELSFLADQNGITMTEQGVDDPRLWWISNTNFTGPIQKSVVAESVSTRDDTYVSPNRISHRNEVKRGSATASANVFTNSSENVSVQASYASTRHLQYVSLRVDTFPIPTGGNTNPIPICMADGSTCDQ